MRKVNVQSRGGARQIRIYEADQGVGMSMAEAKRFLEESRSIVKLGTVDSSGDPNVHPVWYAFNQRRGVLYAFVAKDSKKAKNMKIRRSMYFLVDHDKWPFKGVRGKGEAKELPGGEKTMAIVEKILSRYIRKDHPMFSQFIESTRKGTYVVFEVRPSYYSTWDYGKMPANLLSAGL